MVIVQYGNNSSVVAIIKYHLIERLAQVRNTPPKSVIKLENSDYVSFSDEMIFHFEILYMLFFG